MSMGFDTEIVFVQIQSDCMLKVDTIWNSVPDRAIQTNYIENNPCQGKAAQEYSTQLAWAPSEQKARACKYVYT